MNRTLLLILPIVLLTALLPFLAVQYGLGIYPSGGLRGLIVLIIIILMSKV